MSDASFDQMTLLLGFIFVLLLVIIGVIASSQLKKRKPPEQLKTSELKKVDDLFARGGPTATPHPERVEERAQESREQARRDQEESAPPKVILTDDLVLPKEQAADLEAESALEKETTVAEALSKTEESFFGRIKKAFSNPDKKAVLDEVEEILYTSDLGPQTVEKLLEAVKSDLSSKQMANIGSVKSALQKEMTEILEPVQSGFESNSTVEQQITKAVSRPTVLIIVGVNGAGKTTSIGKITAQLAQDGKKVLVAAGDTFRAAAGNQLKTWTDRAHAAGASAQGEVEIFWPTNTTDPSAVAFDAVQKGKSQNYDYVILDTAGRLHTQANLMEELKKVKRVMAKVIPDAPHETWIVLDANSGQNALMQAKEFHQALTVTGVVLTKMDGTAKGGVALGLVDQLQIPIKLIGIGEKVTDLRLFKHTEYIGSILGL